MECWQTFSFAVYFAMMKYHTTIREIVPALAMTLLFAALSAYLVIGLEIINPTTFCSDAFFHHLSQSGENQVQVAHVDRTLFSRLVLQDVTIKTGQTDIRSERIVADGGLLSLAGKLFSGKGQVTLDIHNPMATISLDADRSDEQAAPSSATRLPSILANIHDGNVTFNLGDFSGTAEGADVRLRLYNGVRFASASGTITTLTVTHQETDRLVFRGITLYGDQAGNANVQTAAVGGSWSGVSFGMTNLIANMRPDASNTYGIEASANQLQLDIVPYTISIPLLSLTNMKMDSSFQPEGGVISLQQGQGTNGSLSFQLPPSTIAFSRKQGEGSAQYLARLVTNDGEHPTSVTFGSQTVTVHSPDITASWQKGASFSVHGLVSRMEYAQAGQTVALDDFSFSGTGTDWEHTTLSLTGNLQYGDAERDLSVTSSVDGNFVFSDGIDLTANLRQLSFNWLDLAMNADVSYHQSKEGEKSIRVELESGVNLSVSALLEHVESGSPVLDMDAHAKDLSLAAFTRIIHTYLPFGTPYVDDSSLLNGNLHLYTDIQKSGQVQFDLSMANLKFGAFRFSTGITGKGELKDDVLNVDSFTLGVMDYRLLYQGTMKVGKWLPSGTIEIANTQTGNELLTIKLENSDALLYDYLTTSSRFPSFRLEGKLMQDATAFSSQAELHAGDQTYPITFRYTLENQLLEANSGTAVTLQGYVKNPLVLHLDLDHLPFPTTPTLSDANATGNVVMRYTTKTDWAFDTTNALVSGVVLNGYSYQFGGAFHVNPQRIQAEDVTVSDGTVSYQGFVSYDGTPLQENAQQRFADPFSFTIHATDGAEQLLDLYVERTKDVFQVMADLRSFDLSRILPGNIPFTASLSLVGDTDLKHTRNFSGTFKGKGENLSLSGDLIVADDAYHLSSGTISYQGFQVSDLTFDWNMFSGSVQSSFHVENPNSIDIVTPHGSSVDVSLTGTIPVLEGLLDIGSLPSSLRDKGFSMTVDARNLDVLGRTMPDLDQTTMDIILQGSRLKFIGQTLNGWYDISSKQADLVLDSSAAGFGFHLKGRLDPSNLAVTLADATLDVTWINKFMRDPAFVVGEGTAKGTLYLSGPLASVQVYGSAWCDALSMTTFFLPDETIYARNLFLWADGSTISSALQPAYITNTSGRTASGTMQLTFNLNGLSFDSIVTDINFPDGKINFYLPITDSQIEMHSSVSGNMRLISTATRGTYSSGSALLENTDMTIGLKDCPPWYVSSPDTSTDFTLTMGKNNRLFYPNTPNPMFSATLQEGQTLHMKYDHLNKQFQMQGDLSIRNGEIFYFQKNFFITEGSVSFNNGGETFQPILNLRARMRTYDDTGTPVDIYLVLKNSTLPNLNPTFESSPQKNIEEIMSLLGQSILPSEAYGDVSLYRVASLATVATDVAQRMGWIREGSMTDLSETIRTSLGLDMFSLHSNVLQNIIIDALPGSSAMTISPLARYLNNTTVFMGKYLGRDMFLQALLHLTAIDRNSGKARTPFLVNDLALNLEISLDWDTPLCTYSLFTQPNELSLVQILDTIGFSVTKRIVLR